MRDSLKIGLAVVTVAIAFGAWFIADDADRSGDGAARAAEVVVPNLSPAALNGKVAFEENCAACHGPNAAGGDKGPPLVHKIYEPGHHGDQSFWLAVRNGARSHHWRFGDMPPVEGVSDAEIRWIVTYVRELQRANGID